MWPFKKKTPPASKKLPWRPVETQWAVGDKCCRKGDQGLAGNAPPEDLVLIVSDVFEGMGRGAYSHEFTCRSVALKFQNWPVPANTDYNAWYAGAFRKIIETRQAEETSIGEKILKAKPAPDIKRKVQA